MNRIPSRPADPLHRPPRLNLVKAVAAPAQRFNRHVLLSGLIGLLFVTAGCSRLFAQQFPTQGLVIEILSAPEDWMKSEWYQYTVSPDGTSVNGTYWSKDYEKEGRPVVKTFVWTNKNSIKVTGRVKPDTVNARMRESLSKHSPEEDEWRSKRLPEAKKQIGDWVSNLTVKLTPDGSMAVGSTTRVGADGAPYVWREDVGFVLFRDFLKNIALPTNYDASAFYPIYISADGTTIVGRCASEKLERYSDLFRIHNSQGFGKNGKLVGIDYGELRLTGMLKSVSGANWVLSVSSITQPNGQTTNLTPAREKIILLPAGFKPPAGVKAGAKVVITGADGGKGKPLSTRAIEIAP